MKYLVEKSKDIQILENVFEFTKKFIDISLIEEKTRMFVNEHLTGILVANLCRFYLILEQ
jgi:hypothetical protein